MTKAKAYASMLGLVATGLVSLSVTRADDRLHCWSEIQQSVTATPPPCLVDAATALAPRVVDELRDEDRDSVGRALAAAVLRRFDRAAVVESVSDVSSDSDSVRDRDRDRDRYRVAITRGGETTENELVFHRRGGLWHDVRWNGRSIVDDYRESAEHLVSRYSLAYFLGELTGDGVVVLADFESDPVGAPPRDWKRRSFGEDDGRTPYAVAETDGNRFLRAEVRDENVMLYKEVRWNAREYPYLAWRWRVRSVPAGSDERVESKVDSAAGLYLTYRRKLGLVPETVKFVWSVRHPVGERFRRPGMGMPWTVVASSGEADDLWHDVVFNLRELYDDTFGGDPGERPLGIGVLSDANNTGGYAAADYDDIVALSAAAREKVFAGH